MIGDREPGIDALSRPWVAERAINGITRRARKLDTELARFQFNGSSGPLQSDACSLGGCALGGHVPQFFNVLVGPASVMPSHLAKLKCEGLLDQVYMARPEPRIDPAQGTVPEPMVEVVPAMPDTIS